MEAEVPWKCLPKLRITVSRRDTITHKKKKVQQANPQAWPAMKKCALLLSSCLRESVAAATVQGSHFNEWPAQRPVMTRAVGPSLLKIYHLHLESYHESLKESIDKAHNSELTQAFGGEERLQMWEDREGEIEIALDVLDIGDIMEIEKIEDINNIITHLNDIAAME